ncbi:unnamed protein product [Agarophyton chilense]
MLIKGVPSTRAPERAPPRPLHLLSQSAISYLQPFFSLSQIHLITPLSFDMQPLSCSPTMSSSHTMSSSPPPRPSLSEHVIPASQYHAVVSRLDSEAELTHRLQSQLVDAQKHVEHLRIQLQSIRGTNNSNNSNNNNNNITTISSDAPAVQSGACGTQQLGHRTQPAQGSAEAHQDSGATRHDKEALSLCSDVSARVEEAKSSSAAATKKIGARRRVCKKQRGSGQKGVKIAGQSRYWTPDEHKLFLEALAMYGYKNLRSISAHVGTRNMTQVRTHSQKYFMRLMREAKRQNPTFGDGKKGAGVGEAKSVNDDKYSVPNTCGMTLLCLVGQDTLGT